MKQIGILSRELHNLVDLTINEFFKYLLVKKATGNFPNCYLQNKSFRSEFSKYICRIAELEGLLFGQ